MAQCSGPGLHDIPPHLAAGLIASIKPISDLIRNVRKTQYDLIIDGQGNFKTALMSLFMRGPTAGFDRRSVREWVASFAYRRKYPASKKVPMRSTALGNFRLEL